MKKYEAPVAQKIEFQTEDSLLNNSILDPDEIGKGGETELGQIPLFN